MNLHLDKVSSYIDRWGNFIVVADGENGNQEIQAHFIEIDPDGFDTVMVYTVINGWDARMHISAHDIVAITEDI